MTSLPSASGIRQRRGDKQRKTTESGIYSEAIEDHSSEEGQMADRSLLDDSDNDFEELLAPTRNSSSGGSSMSEILTNKPNQRINDQDKSTNTELSNFASAVDEEEDEGHGISDNLPKTRETKFFKSDRSEVVKLIYGNEPKKPANDDEDSDENYDVDEASTAFVGSSTSSRPLLRGQRRSSGYYGLDNQKLEEDESTLSIVIEVFIPFLFAGFGTVGAGLVLDQVQHWEVFKKISEVFILVPALLGLKGNLEMTLASRLSTQANLGNLNTPSEQWNMATGNMALIQCQATVVGFLAAIFAVVMDWLPEGDFDLSHALLLCAASLLTASLASFVLGVVMCVVVMASYKCKINPDNVATPIAASLGDLTTLALLAYISNKLFFTIEHSLWISGLVIFVFVALIPVWCLIACQNKYSRDVLYTGWSPVISAMAISSIGGCILDVAVSRFSGIAVFQPVINGVGGNLVAVQASRISTYLHKRAKLGTLPASDAKLCFSPCSAFSTTHTHAKTARVLMCMVIPGHLIFTYTINLVQAGHTSVTTMFLAIYLSAATLQVFLLLYAAHVMILWMWRHKIDPDNSAIPYLTALGDFLGTGLLAIAFFVLYSIGDKDSDVGD